MTETKYNGVADQRQHDSGVALLTLLLASAPTVMAGAIIAPSLPGIQEQFSSVGTVEFLTRLVLTLHALCIAVFAPIAGVVVDRLGRKPVLLVSVTLYGLAGGSGLILNDLYAILAGRAVMGVAVAGIMTSVTALIADYYSGQERSRVLGFQAAFMGFGGVVFLSLGGFLAGVDWRGPFAIYLATLALAPLVALRLWEPSRGATEDGPEEMSEGDETSGQAPSPTRLLVITYTLAVFGMVVFYVVPTQLPFHFESSLGIGPTGSGLAIALFSLSGALTSLAYGGFRARLGYRAVAVVTFVLFGVGFALIGLAGSLALSLVGLLVSGAGAGLLPPNLFNWTSSGAPPAIRGRVLGGLTAALFLGQFLSPVVSQPVARAYGIGIAFVAAAVISALLAIVVASTARTKSLKIAWANRR